MVLRGIGTLAFSTGVEPSVAVVVDDLPVLNQAQAFSKLGDVERVEVLRGPQGTLFGKSSSAGVINIVSRAPSANFGGNFNGSITSDGQYLADAAITGPIAKGVTARLSGFWQKNDGFIRNLFNGRDLAGNRSWGLRFRLNAELGDRLTFVLLARHTSDRSRPTQTFVNVPAGATVSGAVFANNLAGIAPGIGNDQVRFNLDPLSRNRASTVSGKFDLDLGFASLISITGYQRWKYDIAVDAGRPAHSSCVGWRGGRPPPARQPCWPVRPLRMWAASAPPVH